MKLRRKLASSTSARFAVLSLVGLLMVSVVKAEFLQIELTIYGMD